MLSGGIYNLPDGTPYELVTSADRLPVIAREIDASDAIAIDIETTGFKKGAKKDDDISSSVFRDKIRLFSIDTGKGLYVVDLFQTAGSPENWKQGLGPIVDALKNERVVKIIQNAKYEQKWFLYHYNVEFWPVFDPWRASVLVHNGRDLRHDLYSVYERYLKYHPGTHDLGASDWGEPNLTRQQYDYSVGDVAKMRLLREVQKPILAKKGLNRIALIEFGAVLPESAIELNGFPFDSEAWLKVAEDNAKKAEELRKQLIWELPSPKAQMMLLGFDPTINLDSPAQLLESLRKLGLQSSCEPCRGRGYDRQKTMCPACLGAGRVILQDTREMTLAMFAAEHPVIKKLLEYREASKQVSSFGPEYLKHIDRTTGRIHPSYYPFTGAGRYACEKPNLQQIPRDARFRACFRAPPGKCFVLADYSNIEMRIIAEITGDPLLVHIFKDGDGDAHRATAAILTGVPKDQVAKSARQQAKPVNFGFCYGMQAPKMVLYAQANYGVALTLAQATEFRRKFFEGYKKIAEWHQEIFSDENKKKGMTETLAGRIRYLKDTAHNEYANTPVQGLGADGLKAALRLVYMKLKKYGGWNGDARMVHDVHDEIIVETMEDEGLKKDVSKDLSEGMHEGMQQFLKNVPVEVEPSTGPSWAEK